MGISLFEGFAATPGATGEKLLRTTTGFYSLAVPLDLGFNIGLGGFGDASSWWTGTPRARRRRRRSNRPEMRGPRTRKSCSS
jgi:hypothetical protein